MQQELLFEKIDRKRIKRVIAGDKWAIGAMNTQGDLICKVVTDLTLSTSTRIDIDSIDKSLFKMGHDLSRQQIVAGAQNAVQRGLLKKEGRDKYYVPKKKEVYK